MSTSANLSAAAELLREAKRVVVFTGAGISAESGIPTFRDADGFWDRFPVDEFARWDGIVRTAIRQPRRLAEFVFNVVEPISAASPNVAHAAIAYLEKEIPTTVVTQNIDGLHQAANSSTVYEIHGSMYEIVSLKGETSGVLARDRLIAIARKLDRVRRGWFVLPRLLLAIRPWLGIGWHGIHRPNLVLFGDSLAEPDWTEAIHAAKSCDCFLQIGCSGVVYPAALLPEEAKANGASVIAVDPQPTEADIWLKGSATKVVPALMTEAFGSV